MHASTNPYQYKGSIATPNAATMVATMAVAIAASRAVAMAAHMEAINVRGPPTWAMVPLGIYLHPHFECPALVQLASHMTTTNNKKSLSSQKVLDSPHPYEGMCKSESPSHHDGR